MKKLFLPLALAIISMAACCNGPAKRLHPTASDSCGVVPIWSFAKSEWQIRASRADSLVRATQEILKHRAPADAPVLGENLWQYIFSTEGLGIVSGDTWYLHKAFDRSTHKVCFVLEVVPKKGSTRYYKGQADCPRICGYTDGGLDAATTQWYLNRPLNMLPSKEAANLFMRDPQQGLVHTITIRNGQGIDYALVHRATLIQVVQTYTVAGAVGEAVVFDVDESGNLMGNPYKIPVAQLCIVSATDKCMLR